MANQPSPNALSNRVDLYRYAGAVDADGGLDGANAYPAAPDVSAVACGVSPDYGGRSDDGHDRVGTDVSYTVIFRTDPAVNALDKLVWADGAQTRTLFCEGPATDFSGRGGPWGVRCREVV